MSVYDRAYELARALAKSKEYKDFIEIKKKVEEDKENKKMFDDFRKRQVQVQTAHLLGQEVEQVKLDELSKLSEVLNLNPKLKEYMEAEFRLARMMTDVQKIIAEQLDEWGEDTITEGN